MMDYKAYPCIYCSSFTLVYHQYIGDGCCEYCGKWQQDDEENEENPK